MTRLSKVEIEKLTAETAADLLERRLKARKLAVCNLDAGNVGTVAYMWNTIVVTQAAQWKAVQDGVTNKENPSYKILRDADPQLFNMMRTWVQSTMLLKELIQDRCDEVEEIARLSMVAGIDVTGITETFQKLEAVRAAQQDQQQQPQQQPQQQGDAA